MNLGTPTDKNVVKKINSEFVKNCDNLIKLGKGKQVLESIQQVPIKSIPRHFLSQIGSLLNRAGGSHYCLKVLHSYVRGNYFDLGTYQEKTEYAKALIEVGAQSEGLEILTGLPTDTQPELLLVRAFCYFKEWNYSQAIPHLLKYIDLQNTPYLKTVGQINLASAYINLSNYEVALKILTELEKVSHQNPKQIINGYIYEQIGQIYFLQGQYQKAQSKLLQSEAILKNSNQKALLYPQKWQALLSLKLNGQFDKIEYIRKKNSYFKDYETLRDLDYWQAHITNDASLMNAVFFKTPYTSFKNRIPQSMVSKSWSWQNNPQKNNKNLISIFGQELPRTFELTSQLFCHLLSDGYKPMTLGSIHSKLFSDEHFNPFSSPDRIYQILSRLNKKLKNTFDYNIEKVDSMYFIRPESINNFAYCLFKDESHLMSQPEKIFVNQLKKEFGHNNFSAKELSLKYQVSSRTANRWLQELTQSTQAIKIGTGRKTKYKLCA